jgi:uncharacterized phage-associated protein
MTLSFRPDFEKIVELLLYLAHAKPGADIYQAVKFFYLADREHLNQHGRPITYETYCALPYGPVASNAMDLLNGRPGALRKARIDTLPFEMTSAVRGDREVLCLGRPKREVNFDVFSKSDIRVFDMVIRKFGDSSFDDLYNITHKHRAYLNAWRRRGNSNMAPMRYEEMIDDRGRREQIVNDLSPVAAHMR